MRKDKKGKYLVNDLFCGAGGMSLGFKEAGFAIAGAWDNDKFAVLSYKENIDDKVKQIDIQQLSWQDLPKADVWTFGFPCQDISVAGKRAGMVKGKTRSGLFYEVMRLLEETRTNDPMRLPKIILAENVKAVKQYLPEIEAEYEKRGYKLYYTLYNSKYWGVPQNRERYFMVGIRKDLPQTFRFPEEQHDYIPKLLSVLEDHVDEKYYISDEKGRKIVVEALQRLGMLGFISATLTSDRIDKPNEVGKGRRTHAIEIEPKIKMIGRLDIKGPDVIKRVYSPDGISPTLTASEGGLRQPKVLVYDGVVDGERERNTSLKIYEVSPTLRAEEHGNLKKVIEKIVCEAGEDQGETCERKILVGYNRKNGIERELRVALTLTASDWRGLNRNQNQNAVVEGYRIRRLTPREYARLQGFPDTYKQVVSDTQFYKQMGNAVTVTVAKAIAEAIWDYLLLCEVNAEQLYAA